VAHGRQFVQYSESETDDPPERRSGTVAPGGNEMLFVPVRGIGSMLRLRLFRSRTGQSTAVAFSSAERLVALLGAAQGWVHVDRSVVASLIEPLGVLELVIDPVLTAPVPDAVEWPVDAAPAATACAQTLLRSHIHVLEGAKQ
jgi:type III secretion system (T3SS) SseB-like protein